MSRIVRLAPGGQVPLGAAVMEAASDPSVETIVVADDQQSVPESRILDLLGSGLEIGAVVPATLSGPGAGSVPEDVNGSSHPAIAVSRRLARAAEISPREDGAETVVRALIDAVRRRGMRVVREPAWQVSSKRVPVTQAAQAGPSGPRLLIITGFLPEGRLNRADRGVAQLLSSLAEFCPPSRITVAALDGSRPAEPASALRAEGFEVAVPPLDWQDWFDRRWGHFSHVIVCRSALGSSVRFHLQRTQPSACTVLYLDSLDLREIEGRRPITPPPELPGLETFREESLRRLAGMESWVDAFWCEQGKDASLLAGLLPVKMVATIPPAIPGPPSGMSFAEREGIVLYGGEGYDIAAAHEDATVHALHALLPSLRSRDPGLKVTVIADRPSPMLEKAAEDAGAVVVPEDEALDAIGRARLTLALHPHGTGGSSVIFAALQTGTPFLASPQAAATIALGGIGPLAVFGWVEDVVQHARQLLSAEEDWSSFAAAIDRVRRDLYNPASRSSALLEALTSLGISPEEHLDLWPPARREPGRAYTRRLQVPLRPAGFRARRPRLALEPEGEPERYRIWCEHYGPTPEALDAFREELRHLSYQPTISVIMPVYNTDPGALLEAIASVRDQVYPNWELCIADDGSTRPDTLEVLRSGCTDPAISFTRLPENRGISAATNAALGLATGEFVAFLDHDDILKPHALIQVVRWLNADPSLDMIYSDEDILDESGNLVKPHIKPDWSPDHLMSQNYVCHLLVVRRSLVDKLGGLRSEYDGAQDYDLVLRVAEHTDRIAHIPEPLYSWRIIDGSTLSDPDIKPYAWSAGRRALADALSRRGHRGQVTFTPINGTYRTSYAILGHPRVSIIIPTKNRVDLLQACIESILEKTTYPNYELVVIDNHTTDPATLGYLATLPGRVITYPHRFNYSRMLNHAAAAIETDALLFLNNDTTVITPDWIEALLEHAMRPEVGAVGARLHFSDGRIQHEGILVGVVGLAINVGRGHFIRNASAVTGACTLVRPSIYRLVNGHDERLRIAYNDVDLCLRIRQAGYEVIYTPYAELYHHESSTRTYHSPEDLDDGPFFTNRWHPRKRIDPYYSPLFDRDRPFVVAL